MAFPHLVKLQEEHKDKLVIIGVHCQNATDDQIVKMVRDAKINYTIVKSGQVKGKDFSGIPMYFLFNHKGELVYEGRTEGVDAPLEGAVKAAPDWLAGDHPYAKLKSQAAQVAGRRGLGKVLAECRKLAEGPDEASAQEAKWLMERLEPYGKGLLEKGKAAESTDPERAVALYDQASKQFAGDAIGDEAATELKRVKEDPAFKKELDAAKAFKAVEAGIGKLKPCRSTEALDLVTCADCKKKNAAAIGQLAGQLHAIVKKYEGTNAARQATALLDAWGKS